MNSYFNGNGIYERFQMNAITVTPIINETLIDVVRRLNMVRNAKDKLYLLPIVVMIEKPRTGNVIKNKQKYIFSTDFYE